MIKVGIIGATGYAGGELVRILSAYHTSPKEGIRAFPDTFDE